jgi:hypothetical protein
MGTNSRCIRLSQAAIPRGRGANSLCGGNVNGALCPAVPCFDVWIGAAAARKPWAESAGCESPDE